LETDSRTSASPLDNALRMAAAIAFDARPAARAGSPGAMPDIMRRLVARSFVALVLVLV